MYITKGNQMAQVKTKKKKKSLKHLSKGKIGYQPPTDGCRIAARRFWSFDTPCYGTTFFSKDTLRPKSDRGAEHLAACSNRRLGGSESPFQIKTFKNQQRPKDI